MANRNELSNLASYLGRNTSAGPELFRTHRSKPGVENGLHQTGTAGTREASGIHFGAPSNNRTAKTTGSVAWSHLLRQTASGGLSGAFGGGLLGAIGGIGGIVSGITSLFEHSRKTPPPLTLFRLPESENQTIYTNASVHQGTNSTMTNNTTQQSTLQYHSQQIAQAVKKAMLQSSSLNDVIAEL